MGVWQLGTWTLGFWLLHKIRDLIVSREILQKGLNCLDRVSSDPWFSETLTYEGLRRVDGGFRRRLF